MLKEIERKLPVVHVCTIVPISQTVGANRIVPGVAIPHPVGAPELGEEEDKATRRELVLRSFKAMETPIDEQTVFEK